MGKQSEDFFRRVKSLGKTGIKKFENQDNGAEAQEENRSLNPDFAVENLLRLPTAAQLSISEHFLTSK